MQSLAVFDIIILSITLILGLKGLMKGLIKEVFGIVGIIGAVFVGSRASTDVGNILAPILGLENPNTISLVGFVASIVGFWLIVYIIGTIISKMVGASGLGIFDRVLGFVFGAGKIFLIFAVIAHALYQINSFKKTINEKTKDSVVMPFLLQTGAFIMKLDQLNIDSKSDENKDENKTNNTSTQTKEQTVSDKVMQTAGEAVKAVKEKTQEITNNVTKKVEEEVVNKVKEEVTQTKEISQEQIDELKKQLEETSKTNTEEKTNN